MTSNDETSNDGRTRRTFLGTTAAIGALGIAGCNSGGSTGGGGADEPTETMTETATETETETATETATGTKADSAAPDVPVLNYALTLEHLEHAFYREGIETLTDDELMGADALSRFGEQVRRDVPKSLVTVRDHEAAHVEALSATVEKLGGTPVEEAEYDFGYTSPSEFLGVAKALENTGVAAYKGAAPSVSNDDILAAALGIHSVEARHAGFLDELNVTSPFPKAVDEPKTMDEVTEIAGQFVVSN